MDAGLEPVTERMTHLRVPAGVRMGYLLSRYPAISHTFFLHEVLGLRARGVEIETASINAPDRALEALPAVERAEAETTEYIKGEGAAGKLMAACAAHPVVLLRGLLAVLRAPRLTLVQRGMWLLYLAEAMLVGSWMRRRGLRHLHVHFGGAVATVGMLTAAAWKMPWSLTIHGPEELLNVDAYHLREKIAAAKFVFCISDFCRSQLWKLTRPEQWGKFEVVRLGVDPVGLQPRVVAVEPRSENPDPTLRSGQALGHPDFRSSALRLVCTGRMVPEKGHRVLLEAVRRLREEGPSLRVTLIGDGPERTGLEAFATEHGLAVTFAGALSHGATLDLVRAADLFALASFAEGIPVAIMEAMSLGLPCVSTTIAGIPELIEHGVDGLLVPPANAGALAEALGRLAADPELRQRLGEQARERVIHEYNLPINHELLADAFARETRR